MSAPIYRHTPPTLVSKLVRAEALVALNAERAAYQAAAGAGTAVNPTNAIVKLWEAACAAFDRKARFRSS